MGWDRALLCGVNWRDGAGRWWWIVFVVARRHRVAGGVRCFGIASAAAIMCWVTNNLHNMLSRSVTALLPHQESQPRLQASTTPRRTFLASEFCLVLCSRAFGCFALNGVESPVKPSPPPRRRRQQPLPLAPDVRPRRCYLLFCQRTKLTAWTCPTERLPRAPAPTVMPIAVASACSAAPALAVAGSSLSRRVFLLLFFL